MKVSKTEIPYNEVRCILPGIYLTEYVCSEDDETRGYVATKGPDNWLAWFLHTDGTYHFVLDAFPSREKAVEAVAECYANNPENDSQSGPVVNNQGWIKKQVVIGS